MHEHDDGYAPVQPSAPGRLPVLRVGDILLELEGYRVRLPDGSYVPLRVKEYQLLRVLMENHGRVLSEHELLTRVWGPEYRADSNTLAVHIRRLRHAVDPKVGRIYGYIRNVPRTGYTFVALGDTKSCQDPDGAPGPDPAG